MLTFASTNANTLTIDFLRSGYRTAIYDQAYTNQSITWYIPASLHFITADQIHFKKTAVAAAQLNLGWE